MTLAMTVFAVKLALMKLSSSQTKQRQPFRIFPESTRAKHLFQKIPSSKPLSEKIAVSQKLKSRMIYTTLASVPAHSPSTPRQPQRMPSRKPRRVTILPLSRVLSNKSRTLKPKLKPLPQRLRLPPRQSKATQCSSTPPRP